MLAKEKLFIVVYQSVGALDNEDIPAFLEETYFSMKSLLDESVVLLMVPTRQTETKIEFFNIENVETKTIEDIKNLIKNIKY